MSKRDNKNNSETGEYAFDDDVYLAQLLAELPPRRQFGASFSDASAAPSSADAPFAPGPDRLF